MSDVAVSLPVAVLPVPAILLTLAAFMALIERRRPAWRRSESPAWWGRAALVNSLQAVVTALGVSSWELWFADAQKDWQVQDWQGQGWLGVLVGYLLVTFVYYWWHRVRHSVPLLWRALHRFHHSPTRLEVLAGFYKHPLELLLNGALTSALLYFVVGLSPAHAALVVLMLGAGALFTHWNVRTPRWLGYVVQRPEMHRLHHARSLHHYNFSDLVVWDQLFGTYRNPHEDVPLCGFPDERRLTRLLCGQQVREV